MIKEMLRVKLQTIISLHAKIIDSLHEGNSEEIETKFWEQEDYIYDLQRKIQNVSNFKKVTSSNLKTNSQVF